MIVLGALLASFSVICILIPNDAIDYGTAGIAIILSKVTGFNLSLCVAAVFVPFLAAGALILGKVFGLKALVGSLVYTVGLAQRETAQDHHRTYRLDGRSGFCFPPQNGDLQTVYKEIHGSLRAV